MKPERKYMREAIEQAKSAKQNGCYSIGAVIVKNGETIARGGNRVKTDLDPTAHAEIDAIRKATKTLQSRYLQDCILYTTHEPCPMCAAAAIWSKMAGIVYGSRMEDMENYRLRNGNSEWQWRTIGIKARDVINNGVPRLTLVEDFMREDCLKLFHP